MREIRGDRLEQSRIRLERDIDNIIPSPPSMSSDNPPHDDESDEVSSVDFARHNSQTHPSFHSFEHLSHLDSDFYSRRDDDDSIALDPDLGHTMSTAAHHASALTLSAGLRGRGNCNRTAGWASPPDAEFDAERPLQAMLDRRIADGISLFDATARSKSKSSKSLKRDQTHSLTTYDPVVVDSTAELDRFLETGHHRSHVSKSGVAHPYPSRSYSLPAPSASNVSDSEPSSPRLVQALSHQFSPKRPRSAPVSAGHFHALSRPENPTPNRIANPPKPRFSKPQAGPSNLNPTRHHHKHDTVEEVSHDPHTSNVARGCRDIEGRPRVNRDRGHGNENDATPRASKRDIVPPASAFRPGKRLPFTDIVNKKLDDTKGKSHTHKSISARVRLPDVTGLTSAVQSPVKGGDGYVSAEGIHASFAVDLLPALDALQTRLLALERDNSVCRRRVKELEFELEECKVEVARERTRVKEREREFDDEMRIAQEREKERRMRGKMREEEGRYREAVEEKKALEALITTLRAHLARLTSELASHKSLIAGLRADAYGAADAHAEVESLRAEVERLAGEVERLKEVVEEGLRERRRTRSRENASGDLSTSERNPTMGPTQLGIDLTYATIPVSQRDEPQQREEPLTVEDLEPEQEHEHEHEHEQEQELTCDPESNHQVETVTSRSRPYIQASELARVETEMRERRSARSLSVSNSNVGSSRANDSGNGSSTHAAEPTHSIHDKDQDALSESDAPYLNLQPSRQRSSEQPNSRQHSSGQLHSRQGNVTPSKQPALPSTPFPQIRGSRMERLFFSAPEHNARTCTVCHRRKRGRRVDEREDEGSDGDEELVKTYLRDRTRHADGKDHNTRGFDRDSGRLPPQTVLARVVRELEDDFSHYKAIYLELAEQYGVIDAASNVAKRNVLADHLREVIDTLEQKGDQIASLYDLLDFKDKPLPRGRPKHAAFA